MPPFRLLRPAWKAAFGSPLFLYPTFERDGNALAQASIEILRLVPLGSMDRLGISAILSNPVFGSSLEATFSLFLFSFRFEAVKTSSGRRLTPRHPTRSIGAGKRRETKKRQTDNRVASIASGSASACFTSRAGFSRSATLLLGS